MIGELLRRYGFWFLDFIKGGHIRNHYNDIKFLCGCNREAEDRIQKNLKSLLAYASNNTEFYSKYRNFKDLTDFPVIDKNTIKENKNKIISREFKNKTLHSMSTSGSTGTPFTVKQNKTKRQRVLAELIYFGELCDFRIGQRNAFFRIWTEKNRNSKLELFKKNMLEVDVSNLSENSLEIIRKTLKKEKNLKHILAYASSLDILSSYLIEKKDTPEMYNIKSIVSGAEILMERTRENLKKVFGVNTVSRYSNQENGILAQEIMGKDFFMINKGSYYIEFLKPNSDEKANYGETSRIVVTDLFNYAMPMIRYDTGDLALVKEDAEYGEVITSIEGRKRDFIYDTRGNLVSPGTVTANMWKFNQVKQFQFIQEDETRYRLKLNCSKTVYRNQEFIQLFKNLLGKDAEVALEYTEQIPFLTSGKFKSVICNYNPSSKQINKIL